MFRKLIIINLLILSLLSCREKPSNVIRIGILDGPSAVSFIQLIDKQTVLNGKKVEIIMKSEPQQIQALMMRNKLDFAILPTVMAANLYNKGVHFKIVSIPIWGTLYVMTNKNDSASYTQLNSKTIGVFGQGATPDILLQGFIKYNNLQNVKISYNFTTNNDIAQALLQKKINYAVVSEPLVSSLLFRDKNISIVSPLNFENFIINTNVDIFAQTAFLINENFMKENDRHVIKQLINSYTNSCDFVNENPEEAAKLLVKHRIVSKIEVARLSLPLCNIRYRGAFAVEDELMRYLRIFYEYNPKSIGGKIPNRNIIYQP
jgi:NitT/TauT family transport system substrate-binding protein